MTDILLSRIQVLLAQKRYPDAEKQLKELLSIDPNDILALSLMTEVQLELDRVDHADQSIKQAISLNPAIPHLFYLKARISLRKNRYDEAEKDIKQALSLDPEDADFYGYYASIKLNRKEYQAALNLADQALALDAENLMALNMRSTALLKLDRKADSYATIEGALRENPNNPYTHANYGWNLLEQGNHKKALLHFKESLKHNPNYDYAQAGMAEALKANNILYRGFLKYSFWISNLSGKFQIAFFLVFLFGQRILNAISKAVPVIQPIVLPILIGLGVFAFSTWVMHPIGNLFLRLNAYGRYLLKKDEMLSSTAVGICLAVFLIGLVGFFIVAGQPWILLAAYGFTMMIPCSRMFSNYETNKTLFVYATAMAVLGGLAVGVAFKSGEPFNGFTSIYIIGFIAYQWVANIISIKKNNP